MPRLFVSEITAEAVTGRLEGEASAPSLAASLDGVPLQTKSLQNNNSFHLTLPAQTNPTGQTLAIWLESDPSVHIIVPLRLGTGDIHALEDEVKLLRAELELVKTALRRALGPQGQG